MLYVSHTECAHCICFNNKVAEITKVQNLNMCEFMDIQGILHADISKEGLSYKNTGWE